MKPLSEIKSNLTIENAKLQSLRDALVAFGTSYKTIKKS